MMRKTLLLIVAMLLLPCGTAVAQKMYKWIDNQGNVSYHDRLPPAGAGYRVEEKQVGPKRGPAADPAETDAAKLPVVLYVVPKCSSCDLARLHLQKRKIPFTEKNVEKDLKLQEELKSKSGGGLAVPTILVGTKVMNGYMDSLLDGELDQAGYPKVDPNAPADKPADEGFKAPTQ